MGSKKIEKPRQKHKKGLWSPDEDQRLRDYILKHGLGSWSSVPINAGLQRNGKSCRLRWINYLRPGLKRGMFTPQEEDAILTLHSMLGNKWSQIAQHLPGRTDNEIKNHWHSYLKKKVAKEGQSQAQNEYPSPNTDITESSLSSLKSFESFEPTEGTQISGAPGEAPQSNLPKLLFAEWLSLDQFQGQCSGNYGESAEVSKDAHCDLNSSFLDPLSYGLLLNEGLFGGDLTGDSAFEMFYPQFRSDNRFSENGFVSFMAEEDMCSQLNVNDVMYV